MIESPSVNDSLRDELRTTIRALAAAVEALTQATEVLHGTARMIQAGQGVAIGAGPALAQAQISVWEDDPFSEQVPSVNPIVTSVIDDGLPATPPASLQWRISEPRPTPDRYVPGTTEFRFWNAEAALARGTNFWAKSLPQGTRWSTLAQTLPVTLVAGQMLNARYRRLDGLQFFQQLVAGTNLFSAESPDVVCHELGHAILDAFRPELFNAASAEAAAFHEAFGDISGMLVALQLPSFRQKVLTETAGRLNVNSRLSRLAEQLGWGIRQGARDSVDRDSLRNAANRFFYQAPATLPPRAPAAQLSTEAHSFARIFTGAFLDAMAAMATLNGTLNDTTLEALTNDARQLLVDAVLNAPVTPAYFSQVAAAMVQAAQVRNGGRYRQAILGAFVRRGILDLQAVGGLEMAVRATIEPSRSAAAVTILSFGAAPAGSTGYLSDATTAPELPLESISAEFLSAPVLCHAPAQRELFSVRPTTLEMAAAPFDPTDAARRFLADLIQLGRIDPGQATGAAAEFNIVGIDNRTHKLERSEGGLVLKRTHFNCCGH